MDESRRLTPVGQQLAKLPIDPRVARMLVAARQEGCLKEVLIVAAALSVQDPRERPMDKQEAVTQAHAEFADERSDFLAYLSIWKWFEEALVHKKSNRKLVAAIATSDSFPTCGCGSGANCTASCTRWWRRWAGA